MLATGIPLFAFGVQSVVLWLLLWIVFLFSLVILYIVAGHALLYGPHLFIFGFAELLSSPFRSSSESDPTEQPEDDEH